MGRKVVEVVRTKFKDYSEQKKAKRKIISQSQDIPQKEEKILEELLVYKEDLPDSAVDEVLRKLSNNWNKTKVKQHEDIVRLKLVLIIINNIF
ncbi:hypothetical protein C1645_818317 [Glomus cerebriforme]|uniref:Uncharacterized protein n=1 Tax=Glomus cerebriforme TaxID=658196 RepID=A0A397T7Q3_9GLOM|nr:hypothetical protein C1645_818317 [Glomus cerebriforme]